MLKVALITLLVIATRTKDSIESLLLSFDPNDPNVILIEVKAARLCKQVQVENTLIAVQNVPQPQISNMKGKYSYGQFSIRDDDRTWLHSRIEMKASLISEVLVVMVDCGFGLISGATRIGPYLHVDNIAGFESLESFVQSQFDLNDSFGRFCAVFRYFRPIASMVLWFAWYPLILLCSRAIMPPDIYLIIQAFTFTQFRQTPRDQSFLDLIDQHSDTWSVFGEPSINQMHGIPPSLIPMGMLRDFHYNLDLTAIYLVLICICYMVYQLYHNFKYTKHPLHIPYYVQVGNLLLFFRMELQVAFMCQIYGIVMIAEYTSTDIILLICAILGFLAIFLISIQPLFIAQKIRTSRNPTLVQYEQWEQAVRVQLKKDLKIKPTSKDHKQFMLNVPKYPQASIIYQLDMMLRMQLLLNNNIYDKHVTIITIEVSQRLLDQVLILVLIFACLNDDKLIDSNLIYYPFESNFFTRALLGLMGAICIIKLFQTFKYEPYGSEERPQQILHYTSLISSALLLFLIIMLIVSHETAYVWLDQNSFEGYYYYGIVMIIVFLAYFVCSLVYVGMKYHTLYSMAQTVRSQLFYVELTIRAMILGHTLHKIISPVERLNEVGNEVEMEQRRTFEQKFNALVEDRLQTENELEEVGSALEIDPHDQGIVYNLTHPVEEEHKMPQFIQTPYHNTTDADLNHHHQQIDHEAATRYYSEQLRRQNTDQQLAEEIGDQVAIELLSRAFGLTPSSEIFMESSKQSQTKSAEPEQKLYPLELIKQQDLVQFTQLFRNGCFTLVENEILVSFYYERLIFSNDQAVTTKAGLKQLKNKENQQVTVYGENIINLHNISQTLDYQIKRLYVKCYHSGKLVLREKKYVDTPLRACESLTVTQRVPFDWHSIDPLDQESYLQITARYTISVLDREAQQASARKGMKNIIDSLYKQADTQRAKTRRVTELMNMYDKGTGHRRSKVFQQNQLTIDTNIPETDRLTQTQQLEIKMYQGVLRTIQCQTFREQNYQRMISRSLENMLLVFERMVSNVNEEKLGTLERQFKPYCQGGDGGRVLFFKFNQAFWMHSITFFQVIMEIRENDAVISVFLKKRKYSLIVIEEIKNFSNAIVDFIAA